MEYIFSPSGKLVLNIYDAQGTPKASNVIDNFFKQSGSTFTLDQSDGVPLFLGFNPGYIPTAGSSPVSPISGELNWDDFKLKRPECSSKSKQNTHSSGKSKFKDIRWILWDTLLPHSGTKCGRKQWKQQRKQQRKQRKQWRLF